MRPRGGLARRRHVDGVEKDAGEGAAKDLDPAQSRDAEGLTVERVLEGDEAGALRSAVLAPELERELHGHFDRRRAVVAEEDVRRAWPGFVFGFPMIGGNDKPSFVRPVFDLNADAGTDSVSASHRELMGSLSHSHIAGRKFWCREGGRP